MGNLTDWHVVGHRDKSTYKHFGIEGSVSGNKVFSNTSVEQKGSGCFRQCHSSVLSQQTGGGGTHSLEMCLMVWRLMAFCNPRAILLRAHHIQSCVSVIADSLSHRDKIKQTELSLHPKVFSYLTRIATRLSPLGSVFGLGGILNTLKINMNNYSGELGTQCMCSPYMRSK